jgi:ferredoxin
MAEKSEKQPSNIPGKFYVDVQCIDCDVCRDMAPDHFMRNDDEAYSYVYNQPVTAAEIELCYEAIGSCPVEAIGDDGE